jgi:hypothetical protein
VCSSNEKVLQVIIMERASPYAQTAAKSNQDVDSENKQRENLDRATKLALQTVDELNKQEPDEPLG